MIWFFRFLLVAFAAFGIFVMTRGWQLRRFTPELISSWTPTTGVVVDVLRRLDDTDEPVTRTKYFHLLRYADPAGGLHEVWTMTGLPHELPRGTELPLRYDPDDPADATTLTASEGGGVVYGCVALGGGAIFTLIGGYGFVLTLV